MVYNVQVDGYFVGADKIKVLWGDTEYVCDKHQKDEYSWMYGAPLDDTTGIYDFSDYPFNIACGEGYDYIYFTTDSDEEVNVKITEVIETQAEWKKVGGGSSPTPTPTPDIDGDLDNGCTIQPNAWNDGEVDVPFYQMLTNQQYRLYLDGEYIKTETPETDELTGGTYLEYEFGSSFLLSFSNTPGENTTHVTWNINPPQAVTIRLECERAIGPGPGDENAEIG